jgi:hypothetical protein
MTLIRKKIKSLKKSKKIINYKHKNIKSNKKNNSKNNKHNKNNKYNKDNKNNKSKINTNKNMKKYINMKGGSGTGICSSQSPIATGPKVSYNLQTLRQCLLNKDSTNSTNYGALFKSFGISS